MELDETKQEDPKTRLKKKLPQIRIQMPLLGSFAGLFTSIAVGNGVGWNILHFFLGWYYVAYKAAYLFFGQGN